MNSHEDRATHDKREYLTFALGAEQYAVDILQAQEIRRYDKVTSIANAPNHVKGVIHLRGNIVPIIDLRVRFGLIDARFNEQTVVIILNLFGTVVGTVVDSVSDVVEIGAGEIKEAPSVASDVNISHITGIAAVDGRMLVVLDMAGFMMSEGLVVTNS